MAHTVRDYMSRKFVTFRPDMDILEATDLMVRHGISGGPVVDRTGNLVGVLSVSYTHLRAHETRR